MVSVFPKCCDIYGNDFVAKSPLDNTNTLVNNTYPAGPVAQLVVHLTPDQKVVCSNHIRVILKVSVFSSALLLSYMRHYI